MNDLEFVGDYRQPQLTARQRALGHDGSSAGDFTFADFIDIINPLQHIPIVSHLYRAITGDEIRPHARILGGTLFGGPAGFLSSIANVMYEEVAGEDIGETAIAFFRGEEDSGDAHLAGARDDVIPAAGAAEALAPPLDTAAGPASGVELPDIAPGLLTGQDALNALFMDLRGSPQQATIPLAAPRAEAIPLAGRSGAEGDQPTKSYPLPSRTKGVAPPASSVPASVPAVAEPAAPAGAAAHPLLFAQETAEGDLASRMMQALDKYQAMSRRGAAEREEEDKLRWQADPAVAGGDS
ncbi:MAG: hypothetical protein GEU89_02460 [Kiloniellaceae bacterium]|nr:hypothetical protein [Kiloniellaceae bacterium]